MTTTERVKKIVEDTLCQPINESDLTKSWADLDVDSLGLVQLIRDVEDEFKTELEYDVFTNKKVTSPADLISYLDAL
jgi:acyl carrier protein